VVETETEYGGIAMKMGSICTALLAGVCLAVLGMACGGGVEEEPTRTPAATPAPTAATPEATSSPAATPTTYVVQPGDTIGEIAERFGVDVEALAAVNDITNPDLIYVGQTLVIPGDEP
jgi:LysM repeat protein